MSLSPERSEHAARDVGPAIVFRADALRQVESHMAADTGSEYGGVLVGAVSANGRLVVINTAVAAENSASSPSANFTLSHAAAASLTSRVAESYPGQRIVGWYHSHPRFGIFLSTHDLLIQTTFFAQPWQVGYVFDPIQNVRGFFGWAGREIVRVHEWEVTAPGRGVDTQLPVNTPAHGEQLAARLLAAQRSPQPLELRPPPIGVGDYSVTGDTPRRKLSARALLISAGAVIALVVLARFFAGSGDDAKTPFTAASITTPANAANPAQTPAAQSTVPVTTAAAATTTSAPVVETATSAGVVVTAPPTPTAVPTPTAPPTPTGVRPPVSRLATPLDPCSSPGFNAYQPPGDCFLALANGNILLFEAGALRCSEPSGTVIAPAVSTFTVGAGDDPLVIFADGQLVAKCGDLTYAKNILAAGGATFDGLCGSAATPIDDSSVRCFAQNPGTGALVAIVRAPGQIVTLVVACFSAAFDAPSLVQMTWTGAAVNTSWRIVSVAFDSGQQQFVAKATKNGNAATATFACA